MILFRRKSVAPVVQEPDPAVPEPPTIPKQTTLYWPDGLRERPLTQKEWEYLAEILMSAWSYAFRRTLYAHHAYAPQIQAFLALTGIEIKHEPVPEPVQTTPVQPPLRVVK